MNPTMTNLRINLTRIDKISRIDVSADRTIGRASPDRSGLTAYVERPARGRSACEVTARGGVGLLSCEDTVCLSEIRNYSHA